MRRIKRLPAITFLLLALLTCLPGTRSPSLAASPVGTPVSPTLTPRPSLATAVAASERGHSKAAPACGELEAALDKLVQAEMASAQLPGVMVAIVEDGNVALEKGYGWADVANQVPVVAGESLFQMGSLSKLFTWTAVMQLVEQGDLDLHADINNYLGEHIRIDKAFGEPVTLYHLMTHTAGFEDRVIGIYTQHPATLGSMENFLAANVPAQIRPPGTLTSYSNYGTSLAAFIVQRVSGTPFEQYVEENIFDPLAMESSSFRQPVGANHGNKAATGYTIEQGQWAALPPVYTRQIGAGGLTSSASDMSHFMLAYLQNGRFGDTQVLEPETVAQMFNGRFAHHPQIAGVAHGFWEFHSSGHRLLLHTGDTLSFSSMLALLPAENVGVFIAYNRTADAPRFNILEGMLQRCWPAKDKKPAAKVPAGIANSDRFSGKYRSLRLSHTTPARLLAFGWMLTVDSTPDGYLLLDGKRYAQMEPTLFQQVDGPERLAFRAGTNGTITHLFIDSVPTMAFEKIRWWEETAVQIAALAGPLLLFLHFLAGWTINGARSRRQKSYREGAGARRVVAMMSLLALLVAGLAAVAMINASAIVFGMPVTLTIAVFLSFPVAILAFVTLFMALRVWAQKRWTRRQRLHLTALALAGLVYTWFLAYWNVLPL